MKKVLVNTLFEKIADEKPSEVAVILEEKSITYNELNSRANQLAHFLKFRGVEINTPVAICLDKSFEMIIAILAVLKAGATYVPIDVDWPINKINFILEDTKSPIVISQKSNSEKKSQYDGVETICFNQDKKNIEAQSTSNLNLSQSSSSLAYIIYTSGTTGNPKGVMVTHNNLVNAYLGWELVYQLRSEVRSHLQMANFAFDVFSGDLVRALCSGGRLVLCRKEVILDPQKLFDLMSKEKIHCAEFVPAVLRKLIHYLEATDQNLSFMKILICGSDSWTIAEYKKFKSFCGPSTRLINSYGMTEATIDSTYFEVDSTSQELRNESLVPIGKPFLNVDIYLLDKNLKPVSKEEEGEIYVGGAGLANGYLNRPELTTQKFISNPFDKKANSRLYRTGDLGRYLPSGDIELLGRSDNQIKIRGHRIEPNAIESILNAHPKIEESVVLNYKSDTQDSLVAFLVLKNTDIPTHQEIRSFLAERLPAYMLPSRYRIVDELPITTNGKIDRNALLESTGTEILRSYIEPRSELEREFASQWAELLELNKVGIGDSFFDLGGNSLMLIHFLAKFPNYDKIQGRICEILKNPTIEYLVAEVLDDRNAT